MFSLEELLAMIFLFMWVIFVATTLTKKFYAYMRKKGMDHNVAVYYNRKLIHILAGGLCAFLVPFLFKSFIFPLIMSLLLAALIYFPHKLGKLMIWFQTGDNKYEVSFAIMWGTIITLGWIFFQGNFWYGTIPVIFMSVGDAVTGIVRNALYKKRSKSWWGNLAMASFSVTAGAGLGPAGIIAGASASIIEHFEFPPIDDNITVPTVSFLVLLLAKFLAPNLLAI